MSYCVSGAPGMSVFSVITEISVISKVLGCLTS